MTKIMLLFILEVYSGFLWGLQWRRTLQHLYFWQLLLKRRITEPKKILNKLYKVFGTSSLSFGEGWGEVSQVVVLLATFI